VDISEKIINIDLKNGNTIFVEEKKKKSTKLSKEQKKIIDKITEFMNIKIEDSIFISNEEKFIIFLNNYKVSLENQEKINVESNTKINNIILKKLNKKGSNLNLNQINNMKSVVRITNDKQEFFKLNLAGHLHHNLKNTK
jgi:hypothetical protein